MFTKSYMMSRDKAAAYAEDMKAGLKPGCVLTTITRPALLGGCYVLTAIDASLDAIEREMDRQLSFSKRTSISHAIIPNI